MTWGQMCNCALCGESGLCPWANEKPPEDIKIIRLFYFRTIIPVAAWMEAE